ncbi:MAG: SDR family NAD(P)-dependent oxidoreductase, partial [Enhygromyxa sp.]
MSESGGDQKLRAYLERATTALRQTKQRLQEIESRAGEPIAIVAMACRLPGGINTPEQLWVALDEGRDLTSPFPTDRGWPAFEQLYDPDPNAVGKTYTRGGGFVDNPTLFDPNFFGISPREAAGIDPQQRLLLELSWEVLERASIVPATLFESQTGVFVGVTYDDYIGITPPARVAEDGYGTLGNLYSVCSGRISYTLGLVGPALTVDTACSTSLVNVHLAVNALRKGECDLALAGGATVFSTPDPLINFSRLKTVSPDGRCRAFSDQADGAGWGEGAAMLVLERLSDAQRNGHDILAVIRSSAVNQDGRSQGLTAPNGPSQQRVIRAALAAGKLTAADVDVIEAHGTGTSLGDPIEAHALLATYGKEHTPERPVLLGTIKSNLAHTQGAAGVAGIIKLVLALQHERLPRTLHAETPSSKIDWSSGTLKLATEPVAWERGEQPRRGAVSSFGISGTNAHVIVEEAPAVAASPEPAPTSPSDAATIPLLLSGKTPAAIRANAERLRAHLEANPELALVDLGFSLATTRTHFDLRAAILAEDREQALAELARIASQADAEPLGVHAQASPKLALLFSGQGSQHPGMGRELHERHPLFRAVFDEICREFDALLDTPLAPIVFASEGQPAAALVHRTAYTQPALFCFEVALYRLLESWGVRPDLLLGHSIGELTAAHIAGVFSLRDACKLVAARGRLMQALPEGGAMVSIQASADEVREQLDRHAGQLDIAGVNGPLSTVIAGDEAAALALAEHFAKLGRKTKQLTVSHAFHSPRMEPMLDEFRSVVASIETHEPKLPIVSNLTGKLASAEELRSPDYWVHHVRHAVQFLDGVRTLEDQGASVLLELGPHGVLSSMATACLSEQGAELPIIASQHRDRPQDRSLLAAVTELHRRGVAIDWAALFGPLGPRRVAVPTYAFVRERCWVEPGAGGQLDARAAGLDVIEHAVLSAAVSSAHDDAQIFTARLSLASHPWLSDHQVFGHVLVPGTGLLELAATAGERVGGLAVEELELSAPLALGADELALQISVSAADEAGRRSLTIHSRPSDASAQRAWTLHASGSLAPPAAQGDAQGDFDFSAWPPAQASALSVDGLYDKLAGMGLEYGPGFRGLRRCWKRGAEYWAEVELPDDTSVEGFAVHPGLLDAALHTLVLGEDRVLLPFVWSRARVLATGATTLRVRLSPTGTDGAYALQAADASGAPVFIAEQLLMRPASATNIRSALAQQDAESLYRVGWIPIAAASERAAPTAVVGEHTLGFDDLPRASKIAELDGAPEQILLPLVTPSDALASCVDALAELRAWLEDERFAASTLIVVTHRAVATSADEDIDSLGRAALWGLVRAAQAEHPDRSLTIIDVDTLTGIGDALGSAIASNEPQLAIRAGELLAPRLQTAGDPNTLLPPVDAEAWHLDSTSKGLLENLVFVPAPELLDPLGPGEVRIEVKATGLNFRDVLNALGMYPGDPGPLGYEGAGVVTAVGSKVDSLAIGDRVMGTLRAGFGSHAVVDHRTLVRMPAGWSFTQAASVPLVFLTAYYAFVDLAQLRAGERVLIHAASGGVGMAATQLARHLGAEVYGTASKPKWAALRERGFDDAHLANSRTLEFEHELRERTQGEGVDLVLNALAHEYVDASLRLLPRGGRFLEMGKTDVREPERVANEFSGVTYKAFDLADAGPDRIQEMLRELVALFEQGVLEPLPIRTWDMRRVPEAFRYVAQARHIGKVVVHAAPSLDPQGTILITGGTGGLGATVARHLVEHHGARHLLLTSRRGGATPGAAELRTELQDLGASVSIVACDVSQRAALAELLATIPPAHPLTAVFHAAGVVEDGLLTALDADQVERVFRPKVDAATHLHELTRELGLAQFVLFSSVSGTIGTAGQANYAAANAYLDALAAQRHALRLPALSLAWGPWADRGMAARLSEVDRARLHRSGMPPLAVEQGLALLDAALRRPEPALVPVRLDTATLASHSTIPAVLRGLVRATLRRAEVRASTDASLAARLASLAADEAERVVLDLVRRETASVLGAARPEAISAAQPLQSLGLDSLMAVELRNRLQVAIGKRLSATLLFDFPTLEALSRHLCAELVEQPIADARPAAAPTPAPTLDDDPVVIVGMACRYPGGVDSPEALWSLVDEGRDAIGPFPQDRGWALDRLYDPDPDHVGTTYARGGGFLEHPDQFDAAFFGISPREAANIDPQQRLLLELSWEALERAGINPQSLQGSRSGVYVGICYDEYQKLSPSPEVAEDGYAVIGTAYAVVSGRISYVLGLEGPAVTVDTACSTSLVALHLAANAIMAGECELALVGGATVFPTSDPFVYFSRLKTLSPDGRCRSFSAKADGAGWAEGAGVLVVERLSEARRRGHRPLAIIRATAINQDGRSQGLTAPNGPSQQRVIRAALDSAGLSPSDVDVVEAHGTGTKLGDPIEAQAIQATYGREHSAERPLWLGSIKSNLGHAQAAAGVAGVIKLVLALEHQRLPKTLHAEEPSPFIDWSDAGVALLQAPVAWPRGDRSRRGAVSAFGISGTNAHVILEEAPVIEVAESVREREPPAHLPVCLSGKSDAAVRELARRLRELDHAPLDVAYSLVTTRAALDRRAVAAVAALDQLEPDGLSIISAGAPKLAFLFTGQGAQRLAMGRELSSAYPTFRSALDEIFARFDLHLDQPLREVVFGPASAALDQTAYTQPALFAFEVALFRLLASWGIAPSYLLGHSIGELAAAHLAGVLSLDDACKLVAARGELMQALPAGGAMLSIQASEAEVLPLLEQRPGVDIAGLNGPLSTVVSGDEGPIKELETHFEKLGRKTKRLVVSHAFHSHRMDPMLDDFKKVAESIRFSPPQIPIVSNVTGQLATAAELTSPDYWVRHVRQAVRFLDGVRTLEAEGVGLCLELGPHGVLCSMAAACLSDAGQEVAMLPALRRDKPETETLALALGGLHSHGVAVDWEAYFEPFGPKHVDLPTYPFQRQRYWLDAPKQASTDVASAGLDATDHPLLGAAVSLADTDAFLFTAKLSLEDHPWLADHVVFDHVLFPGTGLLDLALTAGAHVGAPYLEELSIEAPLALIKNQPRTLQLSVSAANESGRRSLVVHSRATSAAADSPWTRHASGSLTSVEAEPSFDLATWPPSNATEVELDGLYDRLAQTGLTYGSSFQGLVHAWTHGDTRFAELRLPVGAEVEGFAVHPALLDSALHALAIDLAEGVSLPFAWSGVSLHATGASTLRVRLRPGDSDGSVSLDVADAAGQPLASIEALTTRPASPADIRNALAGLHAQHLYRVDWKPVPQPEPKRPFSVVQLGGHPLTGVTKVDSLDAVQGTPDLLLIPPSFGSNASPLDASTRLLGLLQRFLVDDRFSSTRLAVVTRRAVATKLDEDVLDLTHAPAWGLVRTAASEHPDRQITLLDVDTFGPEVLDALATNEPQLALRDADLLAPRLVPARSPDVLIPPASSQAWHLDTVPRGTLENLTFVDAPHVLDPLPPGHVRVEVRATGLNFRDVLNALGMYPGDPGPLGYEGAGVISAVADDVTSLKVGDKVFGLLRAGFGSHSVVDHRFVTAMPSGWSFTEAASAPLVYLTAYYAFVDLANLQPGERVL